MKRFYSEVAVEDAGDGYRVLLDGRAIKTQGGRPQIVPSPALAEKLASEWRAQGETIDARMFPVRDTVDYAIDSVANDRAAVIDKLLSYAETDTLCYRADPDEPLWHRQQEIWEPLLADMEARENVLMTRVSGIIHRPQSGETLDRLRARLGQLDNLTLAALEQMTALAASLCIGLAALEPGADGEALWAAANLEEDWQVEQWGADEEASALREKRNGEFLLALELARHSRV